METYDETMEYTRQAKRDFTAVGRAWFFYFAVSHCGCISGEFSGWNRWWNMAGE